MYEVDPLVFMHGVLIKHYAMGVMELSDKLNVKDIFGLTITYIMAHI